MEEGERSLIAFSQLFIYVKLVGKSQKFQILKPFDLEYTHYTSIATMGN